MTRVLLEAKLRCKRLEGGNYICRDRASARREAERIILEQTKSGDDRQVGG